MQSVSRMSCIGRLYIRDCSITLCHLLRIRACALVHKPNIHLLLILCANFPSSLPEPNSARLRLALEARHYGKGKGKGKWRYVWHGQGASCGSSGFSKGPAPSSVLKMYAVYPQALRKPLNSKTLNPKRWPYTSIPKLRTTAALPQSPRRLGP